MLGQKCSQLLYLRPEGLTQTYGLSFYQSYHLLVSIGNQKLIKALFYQFRDWHACCVTIYDSWQP